MTLILIACSCFCRPAAYLLLNKQQLYFKFTSEDCCLRFPPAQQLFYISPLTNHCFFPKTTAVVISPWTHLFFHASSDIGSFVIAPKSTAGFFCFFIPPTKELLLDFGLVMLFFYFCGSFLFLSRQMLLCISHQISAVFYFQLHVKSLF